MNWIFFHSTLAMILTKRPLLETMERRLHKSDINYVYVHKLCLCAFLCKRRRSHCSRRRHYHSHNSSVMLETIEGLSPAWLCLHCPFLHGRN